MKNQNAFTLERLRAVLDKIGLPTLQKEEGVAVVIKSDAWQKPMACFFSVDEVKIHAEIYQSGARFEDERYVDGLEFCNDWNWRNANPRVYLDEDGDLRADLTLFHDETLGDEYVEENFARLLFATSYELYCAAAKRLR